MRRELPGCAHADAQLSRRVVTMLFATAHDTVTLALAAWGAALSTALGLRQVIHDRRRVRVIITPTVDASVGTGYAELWGVRVVNVRQRPVEIRGIGLITPDAARYYAREVGLGGKEPPKIVPCTLTDGESVEVYFDIGTTEPRSIRGAFARDSLNHEHLARYPLRTPRARWRAWKAQRRYEKLVREREPE